MRIFAVIIRFLLTGFSAAALGLAVFFLLSFLVAYVTHLLDASRAAHFIALALLVDLVSYEASRLMSARSFALCGRWACAAVNVIVLSQAIPLVMPILLEHVAAFYILLAAPLFAFFGGDKGDRAPSHLENTCLDS